MQQVLPVDNISAIQEREQTFLSWDAYIILLKTSWALAFVLHGCTYYISTTYIHASHAFSTWCNKTNFISTDNNGGKQKNMETAQSKGLPKDSQLRMFNSRSISTNGAQRSSGGLPALRVPTAPLATIDHTWVPSSAKTVCPYKYTGRNQ